MPAKHILTEYRVEKTANDLAKLADLLFDATHPKHCDIVFSARTVDDEWFDTVIEVRTKKCLKFLCLVEWSRSAPDYSRLGCWGWRGGGLFGVPSPEPLRIRNSPFGASKFTQGYRY